MSNRVSLSYGKDSMAMLFKCVLDWGIPVDKVVTVDMMFTETISADLPDLVEFKQMADERILAELGIRVEHFKSPPITNSAECERFSGIKNICGHAILTPKIRWCNTVKVKTIKQANAGDYFDLIGLAVGEEKRVKLSLDHYPLIQHGWTEDMARRFCEDNGLLSPTYTRFNGSNRDGCFFCPCNTIAEKRFIFNRYPDYFKMVEDWQDKINQEAIKLNSEGKLTANGKKYYVQGNDCPFSWKNFRRRFEWEQKQISIFENEGE